MEIQNSTVLLLDSQDEEAEAQDKNRPTRNEKPKETCIGGESIKSIVYAGLDAIVTCFSLISSISAGHLSSVDVLVLGVANLVADGISMGFGDYMSTKTENDMAANERDLTFWEVNNHGRSQELELVRRYQALGMDLDDATTVVKVLSKYKDILVDEKMTIQKGILPADQAEKPWKNGLITFVAFLVFGSAPLLSFIILIPFTQNENIKFSGACVLSVVALAILGIAKAKIAGQNYTLSAATTILNGAVAAASAYLIGWLLRRVAGLHD
ncbi:hypothetical protein AQUCO_03800018v1 [Aquilegia coerulea]|uniref:Vacuolar iron transporter n=1 Tax=Aquilegia coerulea TaxID=218851 RepID=A0A2G5CS82_AQUCA|nr:hypothetical protein AQUCO_03800018v1 [Aquilegia coerulea]